MRYLLDASVAVAALRNSEPFHAASLRRCMRLFAGHDEIVVPAIFDIEVASALVRRGIEPSSVAKFFEQHLVARSLVSIGPRAIRAVRGVIDRTRLRAADALYVWVAAQHGLVLVSMDREVLSRAALAGAAAEPP